MRKERTRDSETLGVVSLFIMGISWTFIFMGIRVKMYAYLGVGLFFIGMMIGIIGINNRNKF